MNGEAAPLAEEAPEGKGSKRAGARSARKPRAQAAAGLPIYSLASPSASLPPAAESSSVSQRVRTVDLPSPPPPVR